MTTSLLARWLGRWYSIRSGMLPKQNTMGSIKLMRAFVANTKDKWQDSLLNDNDHELHQRHQRQPFTIPSHARRNGRENLNQDVWNTDTQCSNDTCIQLQLDEDDTSYSVDGSSVHWADIWEMLIRQDPRNYKHVSFGTTPPSDTASVSQQTNLGDDSEEIDVQAAYVANQRMRQIMLCQWHTKQYVSSNTMYTLTLSSHGYIIIPSQGNCSVNTKQQTRRTIHPQENNINRDTARKRHVTTWRI